MPVFSPVLGTRIGRSVPWRPRLADYVTSWMTLIGAPMREYPYPMETMSGTVEKNMSIVEDVPSINYHIWKPCNMSCRFCFATFQDVESVLPKGHLRREDAAALVDVLCEAGFRKINFAGGEPTLCPWLPDLIRRAKRFGLATSIVTNGSRITPEYLQTLSGNLDWIALSVDSVNPDILRQTGRMTRRGPMSADTYLKITRDIKRHGIRLKVNTVVNRLNHEEDLSAFIRSAGPERWKVFQALAVEGQNDRNIANMAVTPDEFCAYVERNRDVGDEVEVVPESNELMTGSYIMVDPAGRFYDNTKRRHTYSKPILEAGVSAALEDIDVYPERFSARGGLYDW